MFKKLLDHFDIQTKDIFLFCLSCIGLYIIIICVSVVLTSLLNLMLGVTIQLYLLPLFISGAILFYNLKLGYLEIVEFFHGRKLQEEDSRNKIVYNSLEDCAHKLSGVEKERIINFKQDHQCCVVEHGKLEKFVVTETGLGSAIEYICPCGESLDATEYNTW